MPTPPDETGDAQTGDVAMETNADPPAADITESEAGQNGDVTQSEESAHSPSVAVSSVPTSESPIAPLNPQDSPSLHPSCTPDDQKIPPDNEAQLPKEQSATGSLPSPDKDIQSDPPQSTNVSLVQGETPTYTPQEHMHVGTNIDTVSTDQTVPPQKSDKSKEKCPVASEKSNESPIDPQVLLAQIRAETQEVEDTTESEGDSAVVNPEQILAEIKAETQSYTSTGSEIIPGEEEMATELESGFPTDTSHLDSSPTRARSERSGSIEMFGSFYPAHKIGADSKNKDSGNIQPVFVPGARVKRSGSVEMFGSFYPPQKTGVDLNAGDNRISIPRARVNRSGSVDMFGCIYPEDKKAESTEDGEVSDTDSQKSGPVQRFSIPQARTTRSGSVQMFGFSYPEHKDEEGDSNHQQGGERRFSIPQARVKRSGSVEMFGFSYPENKPGESSVDGDSSSVPRFSVPQARVKRSGSVEMFGFSYPVHKRGTNSGNRDRSDSTESQNSDDLDGRSVPFARVKRSGSVEMFGSFYPTSKTGRITEEVGGEDQEKDDPKPVPVQPADVNTGNSVNPLSPIVEADTENQEGAAGSHPGDSGYRQQMYMRGARVKRSGSIEMFGSFYPAHKKGTSSSDTDSGNLQPVSVPRARVKRSGSVEMFGFSYPEKKSEGSTEEEDISDSDGPGSIPVRRFSIPQARTTRSGSVEMFGFSYPEKKNDEKSEDDDYSDEDAVKSSQVRRFSIPQARTTRSGSVEMFGFSYPENKNGEGSNASDNVSRHIRSPWARVKRSGSVEMFGFSYPDKKAESSSGERNNTDIDDQKNGNMRRFYIPQARTTRSGSVEMFGFSYPENRSGESSNNRDGGYARPMYLPRARVKRSGSVEMFGFSYPSRKIQGSTDDVSEDNDRPVGGQVRRFSIPQARTTRSGSVEMFGFSYPEKKNDEKSEDGDYSDSDAVKSSQERRFSIPQARTTRSGSVEMFGFSYPEKKSEEDSDVSDADSQQSGPLRRFSIPQARQKRSGSVEMFGFSYQENKNGEDVDGDSGNLPRFSVPQARVKRSGSVEMFGFSYPVNKSGRNSEVRDRSDSTDSQKSDDFSKRFVPIARVKRSGSVEMFGSFYPSNKEGRSTEEVGGEDQEKDDPKPTPAQSTDENLGNSGFPLHNIVEVDGEQEEEKSSPKHKSVLPANSKDELTEENILFADDPSAKPRTIRSGSVDMFGFMYPDDENDENQVSVPKSILVPGARVKRSGSVEMFGFSYPQLKNGEGSDGSESGNLQQRSVPMARVKRSGSVEMFGFSYPARKNGEGSEEGDISESEAPKKSEVRRFSIPQARTTRSGSVEMFGFSYPEKKNEENTDESNISEDEGLERSQVRRFSIPQARTTRSGSVEMFGFAYPESKNGEGSNDGEGVQHQIRSPWFRVKRSGSVEMFGFSYAARKREGSLKKVEEAEQSSEDRSNPENKTESNVETESEPPITESSPGPRNSTGLPSETLLYLSAMENLDTDVLKKDTDTEILKHAESHTSDTQQSETEHTKSTDSQDKALAASKDKESVSSADFVMIQHEDILKEIKKDGLSPEDDQVKDSDGGEGKKADGEGDMEVTGSQEDDDSANSNHASAEEGVTEPAVKPDVPVVSVTVQVKDPDDQTTTDGQTASNEAAEAEDKVSELPSAVQRRAKSGEGGADESKRRSLMLWVDADMVQTVRPEQGTKSPQHSPEDIPSDLKRLKKVIRKERWASETEHEVRKEMWKQLCLKNSAGASVSHVYKEVEEGLFGKDADSVDPSSITLPSFVDPSHPVASYALKSEGQARLNRLLCVLADTRPDILYCPLLAPISGMLLHYMSPEETFDCLSALLGSTRYKFLEISWVEHESFRMSFEKLAARFAASAHKMFIKQGDVSEIYQDWIWWILEDLPFSHVIRVMDCYLSEGLKIFYRVGLAILMLYKKYKGTAECPEGVASSIREFVRSIPVSPNTLLTVGFQFRGLSRSVIGTYQTKHKQTLREDNSPLRAGSRRQKDVITKLNQINSSIISHQQLHTIWSWVPTRFSIYQPNLVFTTQEHGFSLTTFYTRCEYCEPTIILIKTSDQEIFGAYLSASWSTRNDGDHKGIYFGTGESFLFSLAPEEKKYPWVGILQKEEEAEEAKEAKEEETKEDETKEGEENGEKDGEKDGARRGDMKKKMSEMFMRASPSLIAVGGGDGDGILLEGDLTKGFSTHCLTFENPGLAKERSYSCDVVEVITMEDGRNPVNGETA